MSWPAFLNGRCAGDLLGETGAGNWPTSNCGARTIRKLIIRGNSTFRHRL